MPCSYSYLQVSFYKRIDGAVSIMVVLKESENKVEGLSLSLRVRAPVKPFFFCFRKDVGNFRDSHVCRRKRHVLMFYAYVTRLHSVKLRGLYGDKAAMQELLLYLYKFCMEVKKSGMKLSLNRVWDRNATLTGVSRSSAQKIVEGRRRYRTSSNNQSNHRHLRRKCH